MSKAVILCASLAQKPGWGGFAWVYLNYLLGFRRLGWDVIFVDRLEPAMCVDAKGRPSNFEDSENARFFSKVMRDFEFEDCFSLIYDRGRKVLGMSRRDLVERTRQSDFLINIMGYLNDDYVLAAAPLRVFLDIDPGFGQIWKELGLADIFQGHDRFVTVGANIGRDDCAIPSAGHRWIHTRPPVVLEQWPVRPLTSGNFTSVASWRGAYSPLEFQGKTYGLRVHEFRKFARIPRLTGSTFQLAVTIHDDDEKDIRMLEDNGWLLSDPRRVAADPFSYREFVQQSVAEFLIAKNIYVDTRSGWFSDRSVCYLASGRPVVAQDTGVRDLYPTGEGLLVFSNVDEAVAAVEEVASHPERHSSAARTIAEDYFDSDKVLVSLAEKVTSSTRS